MWALHSQLCSPIHFCKAQKSPTYFGNFWEIISRRKFNQKSSTPNIFQIHAWCQSYFSKVIFIYVTEISRSEWVKVVLTHWHSERPKQAWPLCWYFPHKSVFIKNIWRRIVYQNITNNSPSNILWKFALFPSYFQKYENSRRYFPGELWVWMG